MNPGTVILLIVIGSVVLVTVVTLKTMRWLIRKSGNQQLHEDGILLMENGIDFLGLLWASRSHAAYSEIESVELVSLPRALLSLLFFRYGLSLRAIYTRLPYHFVLLKLKGRRPFEYLLFTPRDAPEFIAKLRARIEHSL